MTQRDSQIEVAIKVLRYTEKALFVDHGGKEPVWVPKSMISDWGPGNTDLEAADCIFLPEWLAKEKGIL